MNIGSFRIEVLSEGHFEFFSDGHINRASVDERKADLPLHISEDSFTAGVNPVLVQTPHNNILLDAGLGWGLDAGSDYKNVSNVKTNLEIFGLHPDDIDYVILSHLHYNHAAGCTFTGDGAATRPTFPNASYVLHNKEWEFALDDGSDLNSDTKTGYRLDDFYRLVADNKVEFLSGESTEIVPGISVILTGGHTPGHQIVQLQNEGESAVYPGDLIPSSAQLNRYRMEKVDWNSLKAKKKKIRLLKQANNEESVLFFYHSKNGSIGRISEGRNQEYVLTDVTNSWG